MSGLEAEAVQQVRAYYAGRHLRRGRYWLRRWVAELRRLRAG